MTLFLFQGVKTARCAQEHAKRSSHGNEQHVQKCANARTLGAASIIAD